MSEQIYKWEAIYAHPDFEYLVKLRRGVVLRMLAVSLVFFFSIPLIVVFQPDVFKVTLGGAINVGLVYLMAQYLIGTVVALRYSAVLKRLDDMAGELTENRHVAMVAAPVY